MSETGGIMLERYTDQFTELRCLLEDYVKASEGSAEEKACQNKLKEYLGSQEMDFVKAIQVVLHIGRTKTLEETQAPEALYKETMNAFNMLKGWRPQEIEINNMIIKVPLDVYLMKGMQILQIK